MFFVILRNLGKVSQVFWLAEEVSKKVPKISKEVLQKNSIALAPGSVPFRAAGLGRSVIARTIENYFAAGFSVGFPAGRNRVFSGGESRAGPTARQEAKEASEGGKVKNVNKVKR